MNKSDIMKSAGVFVLPILVVLAANSLLAGNIPNPGIKGPYEVGFTYFQLSDASRNLDNGGRPIAVYLWYPVDSTSITASSPKAVYPLDPYFGIWPDTTSSEWEAYGFDGAYQEPLPSSGKPFPLVMFSPGWGCNAWLNIFIAERLASHGFVFAVIYHYGDGCLWWEPWDHIALASLNRPLDVSFALTRLLVRNETSGDFLFNTMNPDQVAASGHSLGGYASMVLGGAKDDSVCDFFYTPDWLDWLGPPPPETCTSGMPDSRIRAIVPLDGSNQVLRFTELSRLKVPSMGMGEEWDVLAMDPSWTSWQARQHAAFQGHPAYRVDVNGTYHLTFTNILEAAHLLHEKGLLTEEEFELMLEWYATAGIESLEAQRLIAKYMIAFLKTNLAGESGCKNILTPGYALSHEQNIEFFVTEKKSPKSINADWPDLFIYFAHQPGSEQARGEKDPKFGLLIRHARKWR